MNCPLCTSPLHKMADDQYFICDTCGAYVKDSKFYLDFHQEKNRYEKHTNEIDDVGYQKFTSPITNAILENHTQEHLGLDYGCGTGPVISRHLQQRGYNITLFDPYFYPDPDYLNHSYDYIFSCEVFEHFYRPKQEIEKLLQLLKPGGKLYVMTHLYHSDIDFRHWYYRRDPTHVFIYTKKTFSFIADHYPIHIEKLTDRFIIISKRIHHTVDTNF